MYDKAPVGSNIPTINKISKNKSGCFVAVSYGRKGVDLPGMLPKLYQADIENVLGNIRYSVNQPRKNRFISRRLRLEMPL
jgi:hypothetical protein